MAAANKEFGIGLSNAEGSQKYTPSAATVNGIKGRIWTKRTLQDGCWIYQGQVHVPSNAAEAQVTAAFSDEDWGQE